MAVIVRKRALFGEREVELKTYQPPTQLSRADRVRADRLDKLLSERIPVIAEEALRCAGKGAKLVKRWHVLGRRLREIVDDPLLVTRGDIDSGLLWEAVWYYLPASMKPPGSIDTGTYADRQTRRKGPLVLCYEISAFQWREVRWLQRWADWYEIASRPGLIRDTRIVKALGREIASLSSYPSLDEFRELVKSLGKAFPTRRLRDSSVLSDVQIQQMVCKAVVDAIL